MIASVFDAGAPVARLIRKLFQLRYPGYFILKLRTNGMLSADVYRKISERASMLPDLPFVEIGAASGTATIALLQGFRTAGNKARIVAVEKCLGGSRDRYGGYDDNLAILRNNLRRYGGQDAVVLFTEALTGESAASLFSLVDEEWLSGFMHDADGRLDRDFCLLWPRTIEDGLIIVDDCPEDPSIEQLLRTKGAKGRKDYITAKAWSIIVEHGLVGRVVRVENTIFAAKPRGSFQLQVPSAKLREAVRFARCEYDLALSGSR